MESSDPIGGVSESAQPNFLLVCEIAGNLRSIHQLSPSKTFQSHVSLLDVVQGKNTRESNKLVYSLRAAFRLYVVSQKPILPKFSVRTINDTFSGYSMRSCKLIISIILRLKIDNNFQYCRHNFTIVDTKRVVRNGHVHD